MKAAFAIYYLVIVGLNSEPKVMPQLVSNARYESAETCEDARFEREANAWRVAKETYGEDVLVKTMCDEAPSDPA